MLSFIAAALEGDFLDSLPEIVGACGRRSVGKVQYFTDWATASSLGYCEDHLAAAFSGTWTVLVDDEVVSEYLFDNPTVGAALATRYGTRVVSAFAHSVAGICGYRVHTPTGSRSVVINNGIVEADEGEPLPGEDTANLDKHWMWSVLDVLKLVGLDVADGVVASTRCVVVQLAPKRAEQAG